MRIDVHDTGNHFDDQRRAYAEYRVFSTLATLVDVVCQVGVGLARAADAAESSTSRDVFACSASIRLCSGRQMDAAAHAQHPYEAIDRAARRIAAVANSHADAIAAPASVR
jgi:ribosome-associated translation inhibitor RaiA